MLHLFQELKVDQVLQNGLQFHYMKQNHQICKKHRYCCNEKYGLVKLSLKFYREFQLFQLSQILLIIQLGTQALKLHYLCFYICLNIYLLNLQLMNKYRVLLQSNLIYVFQILLLFHLVRADQLKMIFFGHSL